MLLRHRRSSFSPGTVVALLFAQNNDFPAPFYNRALQKKEKSNEKETTFGRSLGGREFAERCQISATTRKAPSLDYI